MKKNVIFPVLCLLASMAAVRPACAQKTETPGRKPRTSLFRNCTVEGFMQKVSGYTEYHIKFVDVDLEGHSRLSYPIDGYYAGLKFNWMKQLKRGQGAGLELTVAKTLTQPNEAMADSDWLAFVGDEDPMHRWVIGATKSDAQMKDLDIGSLAIYQFPLGKYCDFILGLGYRYRHYNFDLTGLSGWYEDYYYHYVVNPAYFAGVNVLDYSVSFHLPRAGLRVSLKNDEGMQIHVAGDLYYALANDLDDHLLRFKKSETSGRGLGFSLSGGTRITVAHLSNGRSIFIGGSYAIARIKAKGKQTQTFYGDDPGTTEVETGIVLSDIDNTISFRQTAITAMVGYEF